MDDPSPLTPFPEQGLRGGDLLVRIWQPDVDAADFLRLLRDPAQDRWSMPVPVPRPVNAEALQARLIRDVANARAGQPSTYAVTSATTGAVLGEIGTRMEAPFLQIADVGYGTLPEARGRGVATKALRLLSDWLLDPVDGPALARVQLDHATANIGSHRVALGAGFPAEGVRRRFLPLLGDSPDGWDRHDICLHGRVAGEG
jgi:RimJ/RimL family protein N-acetyltransferase